MSDLLGKTLGQYQVLLKIRATPVTAIYKAYDTVQGRNVTLEVILPSQPRPPMLFYKLRDHAEKLQELFHPNIGELLDCEEYEDELCMIYDFVPKGYLRRRFNQRWSYTEAAQQLIPIAQALTYAHQKGIVHGSIRPDNILLNQEGTPTLFDFGVEELITRELMIQTPGYWIGNSVSSYMAPEQVLGKGSSPASDIYSLGAIYYELITGGRPYTADTSISEVVALCFDRLPKVRDIVKDLPETVQMIIEKSLEREPEKRFGTMQHFTNLLGKIALGQPLTAEMVTHPDWQPKSRRFSWWWGLAAAATVGAIVFGGLFWRQSQVNRAAQEVIENTPTQADAAPTQARSPAALAALPTITPEPGATATLQAAETPALTPTPSANRLSLPVFVYTEMPIAAEITVEKALRLVALARWGAGRLTGTAWSPDGKQLALATSIGVFVLDSQGSNVQFILDTTGAVECVTFSPDGKLLATGEESGLVRIWENGSGKEILALGGHLRKVNRTAFSPDGKWLVSGSDDRSVRLWDIEKGQAAWVTEENVKEIEGVAFSPDGKTVISGGLDFHLKVWDAGSGKLLLDVANPAVIYDVAYSPDGKTIYTSLGNMTVRSWDAATGQPQEVMGGVATLISSLAVSADGKYIAAGDVSGKVYVWDQEGNRVSSFANERLLRNISLDFDYTNQVAFLPDSKRLSSGIWDDTLVIWNVETNTKETEFSWLSEYNKGAVFSPNSSILAVQSVDDVIKIWNVAQNKALYSIPGGLVEGRVFSYDSRYLAIKLNASTLQIIEVQTGKQVFQFGGHQSIESISFSSDGKMLSSGVDRDMHLWSLISGQEIIMEKNYGFDGCVVQSGMFSSPIQYGTRFGLVDFISGGNTALCRLVKGGWMDEMVIQPGGNIVAAGGTSKIEVWNLTDEKTRVDLQGLMNRQTDELAVAPSGSWVAAALDDLSIRVWDAASGNELVTLIGHEGKITGLAISPDGRFMVSTSLDGTTRIWGIP